MNHPVSGVPTIYWETFVYILTIIGSMDVKIWKGTHQVKSILKLSDPHIWQESMSEYDPFPKLVYTDWS